MGIEVVGEIKATKSNTALGEISKKLILMAPLSGKSGDPVEEKATEPRR